MRSFLQLTLVLVVAVVVAGNAGCAAVQPWEKNLLAQETMQSAGPVPGLVKIDNHVYFSKEAVRGGSGVGGGGCGCN
jgi:hypothetical protein